MNYVEHRFALDVHETVSRESVCVKKGNTAHRLLIHLMEKGRPFHISPECYAVFTAKKPDGKVVFNDCTIEDCVIIYDFTPQTVAAVGLLESEIMLYGADDTLLTSSSFRIVVEDTVYDEGKVESKDEVSALTHLVSEAAGVINDGNQMIEQGQQTIQSAETATQQATSAAGNANGAAATAIAAAQNVVNAANQATAAATAANSAASNAETATSGANASAKTANDAAASASAAASEAVSAAKRAEEAADSINSSGWNAELKDDIAALQALGLQVVDGKICQAYKEE